MGHNCSLWWFKVDYREQIGEFVGVILSAYTQDFHLPRKVLEMNSETWFPDRLISDRCVNSRFNILLNCKRGRGGGREKKCRQFPLRENLGEMMAQDCMENTAVPSFIPPAQ